MAITLTIGGVSKHYVVDSLRFSSTKNGNTSASFEIRSNDGTYRPALDADVVISENGTPIIGGLVDEPDEEGVLGDETGGYDALVTHVNVISYHAYTERRFVNETLAAGTLKSMLTTLVANYLSVYGITLDAGQANGPTLPELPYEYTKVSEVLNELSTLTGKYGDPYVWTISPTKVLSMAQPSSDPAPFDITDGDGNTVGDITVTTDTQQYRNKIIIVLPSKTEANHVETFTANGIDDTFPLTYTLTAMRYTVQNDGSDELLTFQGIGFDLAVQWLYDATTNSITRLTSGVSDPPAAGTISITFDGTLEGSSVSATDASYATNPWEEVLKLDKVPEDTTVQAIADAMLVARLAVPRIIKYQTKQSGLLVGQKQTITCGQRDLSALDCVITDISAKDYGGKGYSLMRSVTLTSGVTPKDGFRDVLKQWSGDKTGSALESVAVGAGAPAVVGPAPPDHSVQVNNLGSFYGEAEFVYYKDENSLICGGGGCSITAAAFESCQVFGDDNHISD